MRVGIVIILIFTFLSPVIAQNDNTDIIKFRRQKYALGISPLAILNTYNTFQLNQDYALNDWMSISLETGYIFSSYLNLEKISGYRLRGEFEFLIIRGKDSALKGGVFINQRNTWNIGVRNVVHPMENYKEIIPYLMNRKLLGYGFFIGVIFTNDSDNIFSIDIGLGSGQFKVSTDKEIPDEFEFGEFFILPRFSNPGTYDVQLSYLNFSFSHNLGFHNQKYIEY